MKALTAEWVIVAGNHKVRCIFRWDVLIALLLLPLSLSAGSKSTDESKDDGSSSMQWLDEKISCPACPMTHVYLSPGVLASIGSVGGELSVSLWERDTLKYFGLLSSNVYDTNRRVTRLNVGPMVGLLFLGVSAGYAAELRGSSVYNGITATGFVSVGYLSGFYRHTALFNSLSINEFGIVAKMPFGIWKKNGGFHLFWAGMDHGFGLQ